MTGYRGVDADVTAIIENEKKLKQSNDELEDIVRQRTAVLEETNAAFKVLLNQREDDKTNIEKNMVATVQDLILPYIGELKKTTLTERQLNIMKTIESNLDNLVRPFAKHLASKTYGLSPMEIKVANLVSDGHANKEIARLLGVSLSTVLTHRHHLRDKLGLKNKKINLRSHLLSLH